MIAALMVAVSSGSSIALGSDRVVVVRLDGSTRSGAWDGVSREGIGLRNAAAETARIVDVTPARVEDATPARIPLGDVASVRFDHASRGDVTGPGRAPSADGGVELFLRGGGRFRGRLDAGDADGIAVSRPGERPDRLRVSLDQLEAVRFARPTAYPTADTLFRTSRVERSVGEDVLIPRDVDDPTVVRGTLESLGPDGGSFRFGGRSRRFQADRVYALVLASGAGVSASAPARVTLTDGSVFPGNIEPGPPDRVILLSTIETRFDWPIADVARIDLTSDRRVYLSDLTPTRELSEGILHRSWPTRRDANVRGGPIMLGGTTYAKGLGVHSRSEVEYTLDGRFETFVSVVGLDDRVRPRGNVVFSVLGDGRVLATRGPVTGRDPPERLVVAIGAVRVLTLIVDYGDGLDLADQADWAAARLIRPRGPEGD